MDDATRKEQYEARLTARLYALGVPSERRDIPRLLAYAGLMQMVHEFVKVNVLNRPRLLFGGVKEGGTWTWANEGDEARWHREVRSRHKSEFQATLLWFIAEGAITEKQSDTLARLRRHRDDLTHRMAQQIFKPGADVDPTVLTDSLDVFKSLDAFWLRRRAEGRDFTASDTSSRVTETSVLAMMLDVAMSAYFEAFGSTDSQDLKSIL